MADEELPLEAGDVSDETKEEVEVEEEKELPVEKKEEEPSRPDVERAARLLEAASKPPEKPKPASELDAFGWQTRMVSEFREITDPTSQFFKVAAEKRAELVAQNHPDPDLDYLACKAASADPRITRTRSEEATRERRVAASSGFERPSSQSEGERRRRQEQPDLTEREMAHAKGKAKITDKAALRAVAEGLAEARRMQ